MSGATTAEVARDAAAVIRALQRRVATLEQRSRRLHEALSVYGQHLDECAERNYSPQSMEGPSCDCGLDAIERECAPERDDLEVSGEDASAGGMP